MLAAQLADEREMACGTIVSAHEPSQGSCPELLEDSRPILELDIGQATLSLFNNLWHWPAEAAKVGRALAASRVVSMSQTAERCVQLRSAFSDATTFNGAAAAADRPPSVRCERSRNPNRHCAALDKTLERRRSSGDRFSQYS